MKKLISMCLAACLLAGCGSTTHDEKNKKEMISILKYPYTGQILTYQEFLEINN